MDSRWKATSIPLKPQTQGMDSYPLNLKPKVWNLGEKDGGYEHYLVFLEKWEESRSFDVFLCFLDRNMVRKERKQNAQKLPK